MSNEIILTFFCNIMCLFNLTWIYLIITERKLKVNLAYIIVLFICTCVTVGLYYLNITPVKTVIAILTLMSLNKFISKEDKLKETIIYSIFIWLIGMLLDIAVALICSAVMNYVNNDVISLYALVVIFSFVLQVFYNLMARTKPLKKLAKFFFKIFDKVKVEFVVLGLVSIILVILGTFSVNSLDNEVLQIFIFGFSILLFLSALLYVYSKYQKEVNSETISLLLQNNKFYSNLNIETRQFKHNLIHKLDGVKSYGDDKVKKLIDEIILDCNLLTKNNKELDKLPLGLNGFIYQKVYQVDYKTLNIAIDNSLKNDLLDILKPKTYNKLCEVLGVMLDNALEATLASKEKLLYICIEENEHCVELLLNNSFESDLNLDKLGNINYTTKGSNHGIGIFSTFRNKTVKTKIKIVNNLFETKIVVNKTLKNS